MLYRLDERTTGPIQILVQSHERPEWALPGGYLLRHGDMENPACRPVDEFYAAIEQGMVLRFRLRANPTKRVHPKSEPEKADWHGKRVELREEAQWLGWLMRKGEMHGFALPDSPSRPGSPNVRAVGEGKLGGRRPGGEEKDRLTLGSVLFNGTLAVTDPERFRAALATGIGSGKAYGFGLLSVARLE
jgi:CRISPR system Cascade subunit CasE